MKEETRTVVYDDKLRIEAYRFEGIVQPFPNHFQRILYIENIRIGAAKKMLEQGVASIEAAMQTGFSDQSHFTNFFNLFIGLSPGAYREIFLKKEETCFWQTFSP